MWKGRAMNSRNGLQVPGWASPISVMLTAIAITANHVYPLGGTALVLGTVLLAAPAVLFALARRTGNPHALAGYVLLNIWIVLGFGAIKGLWAITLPVFAGTFLASSFSAYPKPVFGPYWFEISGVAMFIGSVFVLYFGLQMLAIRRYRALLATAALVAYASVVVAFAATTRDAWVPPAQGVVRIGVIVPTEGPYAMLGNSFVKAVQMAKDDLKDTKYRYELVVRDSGPDPEKAKDVIRQVVRVEQVNAIVGGISLIGQVTKPYATRARIPHLCVCTVSAIGDGAYNFTNIPSPEAEGVLWAHEARRRGISNIALITQDYPSINNHVKALKVEAAREGLRVTYERTFADTVTDFRSILADSAASKPDLYYVEALNPALDRLAEQMNDVNIRNVASVVAPSLSNRTSLFEGAWYTDSNLRDVAFKTRFEERYPGTRFATHMMPYAYDSL